LRAVDAFNPFDVTVKEALMGGVTTVVTGPGSANVIGGQLCAVKTYGVSVDEMLVKSPVAMKMSLGENPKSVYAGRHHTPMTRMATAALLREYLSRCKRYIEDIERARADDDFDMPEYDAKLEALMPLFTDNLKAHIHAHRADDIMTAIRIMKEFGLGYVIVHCTDGHRIAPILTKENVSAIIGPSFSDRSKPELAMLAGKNAAVLHEAKVPFAICTDHPVTPVQYLPLCAALSVREGLNSDAALRAVTINAAVICGIDDRVGSIERTKDADLIFFDKDPLSVLEKPKMVIINGQIAFRG
jgi:imidazolonepropionase-like amidohydrolase